MFPKKSEWSTWGSIEKATYIAQALSPIALLLTVIFAWLGWRVATEAQLQQREYFIALNSPKVEVTEIKIIPNLPASKGIITFVLKNVGGSPARKVCIKILEIASDHVYRNTCDESDHFKNIGLAKGGEVILPLLKAEEFEASLGYFPSIAKIHSFIDDSNKDATAAGIILIDYEGIVNDKHGGLFTLAFYK